EPRFIGGDGDDALADLQPRRVHVLVVGAALHRRRVAHREIGFRGAGFVAGMADVDAVPVEAGVQQGLAGALRILEVLDHTYELLVHAASIDCCWRDRTRNARGPALMPALSPASAPLAD